MNKKLIKIITTTTLIASSMLLGTTVKATVENKPGGTVHTNISASESYQLCYDMRSEALGNNTLDPHLTTNADWGAVAYLAVSSYGGTRNPVGTTITINGENYRSTTNNITGVLDMGTHYTYTASLFPESNGEGSSYRTNLKNNLNTKYVETLGTTPEDVLNKGRALGETNRWYNSSSSYVNKNYPIQLRKGVLGYDGSGEYMTFR